MWARAEIGFRWLLTAWLMLGCTIIYGSILPGPGIMSLDTIKPCPLLSNPTHPSPVAGTLITAAVPSAGQIQGFVLHTGAGSVLGDVISYNCDAPNFGDFNFPLLFGGAASAGTVVAGDVYYISSVTWSTCGDVNSIAEISIGQPVVWNFDDALEVAIVLPDVPINLCDGDQYNLDVSFSVPGNYSLTYAIDGVPQNALSFSVSEYNELMTLPIADSGTYCLSAVSISESTCPVSINNTSCVLARFFSRPEVSLSNEASICAGEEHCFDIDISGQGPFTVLLDNAVGNSDIYSAQPAGVLSHCVNAAGFYSIQELIDFNGCQPEMLPPAVELIVNPIPTAINPAVTSFLLCENICDQISIDIPIGTFPMLITLDRPLETDTIIEIGASPWTLDICDAGVYQLLELTDAHTCISAPNIQVNADAVIMPESAAGANQQLCLNESIEIGSLAFPGATYNWQPHPLINTAFQQNSQIIITPVDTGWVSLVLDVTKQGCVIHDTVEVYTNTLPNVSVQLSSNAVCLGQCAEVVFSGAEMYSWNESLMQPTPVMNDTLIICPEITTNYVFTGTNDYGELLCSSSQLVTVSVSDNMIATVTTEEVCFGSCSGTAAIIMSGGIPPYFSSSVNSDFVAESLCPGYNEIIVTDAAGCIDTVGFNISERPQEIIDYFSAIPPTCFGDTSGQVNAYDADAAYLSIYHANSAFPFLTDETAPFNFSNLPAGDYLVVMTIELPEMSCYDTVAFSFESQSPQISISTNVDEGPYCVQSQVCLQAMGSGGLGSLTPHWNRCEESINCQSSQLNPFCFSITRDTVFYVHFTDQNGCTSDTISIAPFLYQPLITSIEGVEDSALVCEYDCVNLIASAMGGNGDYHYQWTTAPGGSANSSDTSIFQYCPTYTIPHHNIIVKLFDNCVSDVVDTVVIEVKNTPDFQVASNLYDQCVDSEFKLFYDLETNFSDAHTCRWNFDTEENDIEYCGDTSVVYTVPGKYYPYLAITSEFGCTGRDTMNENFITVYPQPELDFWWEPVELDILSNSVQFNCEPYGVDSVIWNFHNAGRSTLFDPVWTFPSVESELPFFVCMVGYSGKGCLDTLCRDVFINPVAQVFAPNSFTPNGDGINEVFRPYASGAQPGTYSFTVYTRRGETIFYTDQTDAAWTGGIDDHGYYVPAGTYVWRIEFRAQKTDTIEVYTGTINLLR